MSALRRLHGLELPLDADSPGAETVYRRLLHLSPGHRAVAATPEPDRPLGGGSVLAWSGVVARGQTFESAVTFEPDGGPAGSP